MRIILIVALSLIAFGGGFIGVYMNLPEPGTEPTVQDMAEAASEPIAVTYDGEWAPTDSTVDAAWLADVASQARLVSSLIDSLTTTRSDLQVAWNRIKELEDEIARLHQLARNRADRENVAAAMAATLPKLEPDELTAILDGLDEGSLFDLYEAASNRNRPTILQALKPDRAAYLVQRFMSPSPDSTSRILNADI